MKATDRDQARRLGVYVDELVNTRRKTGEGCDALTPEDQELDDLRRLARQLHSASIEPPAGFKEALAARLAVAPAPPPTVFLRERPLPRPVGLFAPRVPRVWVTCAVVLLAMLWLSASVIDVPAVSAQAVLHRSDVALTNLVKPGQVLYRRWRVTSTGGAGMMTGQPQDGRIIEEWMDGGNSDRVAAHWLTPDGQLQVAYTTIAGGDGLRPHVYFSPGVYGEARGLLNIEPTQIEFEQALSRFSPLVSRALRVYLDRHYIYAPIKGEREYNRAIFTPSAGGAPEMPRVLASHDTVWLNGDLVYRVRLRDDASVTFNWRSDGPSAVRVGQAEIVRYISQASFLSVRTEERIVYEDGRRRESVRELEAAEVLNAGTLTRDPFVLDLTSDPPVKHQSAYDHLTGVAAALQRSRLMTDLAP